MSNETTIPALLQRWSEVQPDTCWQTDRGTWAIGDIYTFGFHPETGEVAATCEQINNWVYGRPALAWLRDAVEAAVEAAGLIIHQEYWPQLEKHVVKLWLSKARVSPYEKSEWRAGYEDGLKPSAAHALLAAFVAHAETVKDREVVT